jgi:hypothetical protein
MGVVEILIVIYIPTIRVPFHFPEWAHLSFSVGTVLLGALTKFGVANGGLAGLAAIAVGFVAWGPVYVLIAFVAVVPTAFAMATVEILTGRTRQR